MKINYNNKIFFTVFIAHFIAYGYLFYIHHKSSRIIKISCEILLFILCEIAIWAPMTTFLDIFFSYYYDFAGSFKNHFSLQYIYLFILYPIHNTLSHLTWIYHSIRGVSAIVFNFSN